LVLYTPPVWSVPFKAAHKIDTKVNKIFLLALQIHKKYLSKQAKPVWIGA
jgi:hypothetical protein